MKKLHSACLVIAILVFTQVSLAQNYTSQKDEFTVWFPATPKVENLNTNGISIRMYSYNIGGLMLSVAANGLPQTSATAEEKSLMYDGGRDNVLAKMKGKVVSEKDIVISGISGRELKFTSASTIGVLTVNVRFFVVRDRLYQVMFVAVPQKTQSPQIKKFFDSFKFTGEIEETQPIATVDDSNDVNTIFQQARQLYENKNYTEAIKIFSKVIKLSPNYEAAYFYRGSSYYESKQYPPAITDYTKAITLSKENDVLVENIYNRCLAYSQNKNSALALTDCNKVISLNPEYWQAYFQRGNLYYNSGKISLAVQDYSKTIELKPLYKLAYTYRADCYDKLGKADLAKKDRDTAQTIENQ